jgi:prepilin-type N-terminal cleavage/methylation domain-containing protein
MLCNFKNRGFSLIEMMIVMGIMSVVMFSIMQFTMTSVRTTKSLELNAELDQMMIQLQLTLKDPTVCANNIGNLSSNPFNPTSQNSSLSINQINSLTGQILGPLINNGGLPNTNGTSVKMALENFNNTGPTNYTADLAVTLDKGPNANTGGRIIKRSIVVGLVTSGTAPTVTITGCNAVSNSAAAAVSNNAICALFGGTYNAGSGLCTGTTMGQSPPIPGSCPAVTYTYNSVISIPVPATTQGTPFNYNGSIIGSNGIQYVCIVSAICNISGTWGIWNGSCH